MKIVVAGATGLIGRQLTRRLRERGDEVVALVRRELPPWAPGLSQQIWDGSSPGPWTAVIDGADGVVNLAGASIGGKRWSVAYKDQLLNSRLEPTSALVEAMRSSGRRPRVFVSGSAVGYYGFHGDEPLEESSRAGTDFLAQLCDRWETVARGADALGVRTVLLRTGIVLAREGGALQQMLPPFKAFVGGPIGDGKQWLSWIHIDDEVGLILSALDRELRGPLNAAAPEAASMKDFSRAIGAAIGRPSWLPAPAFALRALLGEFASVLTKGQRVVPKAALASGYVFRFPSLAGALADLMAVR
jgi:uncharacterized protein (TIGR01777 family)